MKKTKFYHKIVALALLFSAMVMPTSCNKDVLNEDIVSNIGNDYLNTPAGFNDGVKAAYSSLRTWYGTEIGCNLTVFGTDTYQNGADGSWKFINTYAAQFDPRTGQLLDLWNDFYRGINVCNAVIERSAKFTGLSDVVKKQRIAEVKFLRAHYFFILTQAFGGVDLRLTETIDPTKVSTMQQFLKCMLLLLKIWKKPSLIWRTKQGHRNTDVLQGLLPSIFWQRFI